MCSKYLWAPGAAGLTSPLRQSGEPASEDEDEFPAKSMRARDSCAVSRRFGCSISRCLLTVFLMSEVARVQGQGFGFRV